MSQFHPNKGKLKSAFAAGEASYVTGGASDQDTSLRDASDVCERAPSARTGSRGNPRQNKRKTDGQSTRSKQSTERDTAAAGGNECPACGQRHGLSECYYVYADRAPEWFKPNQSIVRLIQYKINNDDELQRLIHEANRGKKPRVTSSSSRSVTPFIKNSQTPDTPAD